MPYTFEPHAHVSSTAAATHDFYPFPSTSGGGGGGPFVPSSLSHGSHSSSTPALNKPQPRNKKALDIVAPPSAAHASAAAGAQGAAAQSEQTQSAAAGANVGAQISNMHTIVNFREYW